MTISAVPFLLPLMFQLAYGWTRWRRACSSCCCSPATSPIKPATSPLIRRWGFRTVLVGSTLGGAAVFLAIALLAPTTPKVLIGAVMVLSGALRSIGFSAYNSLQFADIDGPEMTDANTLASLLQQVATGLGVALGAVTLRLVDSYLPPAATTLPYSIAFAVLAVLMLYPLIDAARLHRSAGSEIAGRG